MVLAHPSPRASHPRSGDRILIFKPEWLRLVLAGHKTLEVRAMAYKAGRYYFGTGGSTIENMSEHRLVWVGGGGMRRDLLSGSSGTSFSRRMLEALQEAPGAAQSDHRPAPIQDDVLPPHPECEEDSGAVCSPARGDNHSEIRFHGLERAACRGRHVRGVLEKQQRTKYRASC